MSANVLLDPNDPALRSWVPGANDPEGDFPIQNLPYGTIGGAVAVRIGDSALILRDVLEAGLFVKKLASDESFQLAVDMAWINGIAELEPSQQAMLRQNLAYMLAEGSPHRAKLERNVHDFVRATLRRRLGMQ